MGIYSDHIFPRFYDLAVNHKTFHRHRKTVLSHVEEPILELGIGTGINLDFYPEHVTEITSIDANPGMERQLKDKLKTRKMKVHFHLGSAEHLPFKSETFQSVVSTITLCSIPHLQLALSEVRRVLKPSGKFIFFDHGIAKDQGVARIQRFLNPAWGFIGCGCKLIIDIEKELKEAQFTITSLKNFYVERYPKFIGHFYEGTASR